VARAPWLPRASCHAPCCRVSSAAGRRRCSSTFWRTRRFDTPLHAYWRLRHTLAHTHLNSHALALVRRTRNPNMCVLACHTLIPIGIFLCTVSLALAAFKRCWSQPADTFTASVHMLSCALAMCALRAGWVCGVPFRVGRLAAFNIALNCTSPARKTQSITRVYLRTRTFTRAIRTLATWAHSLLTHSAKNVCASTSLRTPQHAIINHNHATHHHHHQLLTNAA
jgi:cytochrome bd-type quinol oxidase subunit 1